MEFTVLISMIMAIVALAIDMILPAFGEIRQGFGLAEDSNQLAPIVTFFFIGLAVGQPFWGPLSDALGRKRILYWGLAVYIIGTIGAVWAPSLATLFLFRFIGGLGAAGPRVVALSVACSSRMLNVCDWCDGRGCRAASAVIGATTLLGGSRIASLVDHAYDGTVLPFGIATGVLGIVAFVLTTWAQRSWATVSDPKRSRYARRRTFVQVSRVPHRGPPPSSRWIHGRRRLRRRVRPSRR